jgi:hypothetical protein
VITQVIIKIVSHFNVEFHYNLKENKFIIFFKFYVQISLLIFKQYMYIPSVLFLKINNLNNLLKLIQFLDE